MKSLIERSKKSIANDPKTTCKALFNLSVPMNIKAVKIHHISRNQPIDTSSGFNPAPIDVLGRSQMEPGMNQGLRMLSPGAQAILIMPPFLAYGLIGDGKMIPSRAVIVYSVKILHTE